MRGGHAQAKPHAEKLDAEEARIIRRAGGDGDLGTKYEITGPESTDFPLMLKKDAGK